MGTNWGTYNLPAIWEMLQGENACTGADRVLAWDGLATSVREQHRRLLKAGDDLAAVWSPETNASAILFLEKLGGLADSMQETLICAEDTRAGLRGVMEALGEAQGVVRSLAEGRSAVSDDLIPRFIDHAEDEYDVKAQQAMRAAESVIADHSTQINAPALFIMGPGRGDTSATLFDDDATSTGSTSIRATPVPVVVPHEPVLPDPASNSSPASGAGPNNRSGQDSLGIGLGLSGVTAPQPSPIPALGSPVGVPPAPGAGGGGPLGSLPLGAGPLGLVPGTGGPSAFGAGSFGVPGGRAGAEGGRQPVSVRRGLPSGAVIGEGGLGPTTLAGQPPVGTPGRSRGRGADGGASSLHGDADEQWETLKGVAPVIAPDTRPVRHDPGPGILGLDR